MSIQINVAVYHKLSFISGAVCHTKGYLRAVGHTPTDYIPAYTIVSSPPLQMIFIYWLRGDAVSATEGRGLRSAKFTGSRGCYQVPALLFKQPRVKDWPGKTDALKLTKHMAVLMFLTLTQVLPCKHTAVN